MPKVFRIHEEGANMTGLFWSCPVILLAPPGEKQRTKCGKEVLLFCLELGYDQVLLSTVML